MNLTPAQEALIKSTYSDYHAGAMTPEEALYVLEQMFAGNLPAEQEVEEWLQ